uniref:hypothetical protein n=1 Tax=uncultured Microscilla sp. TaxID=432653 RepID=UPI00260C59D9
LHEVLKDTTRSPAKLQIVEYLLKKGAPPNGGRLLYGPEVRPVATAIESWDLEAFWLLKKYGAKLTGKYFNALSWLVRGCDCFWGGYPQRDSIRQQELEATIDTLIKKHHMNPYGFYNITVGNTSINKLFFKYVPPEKLDTKNYDSPIKLACERCNLALIKKYKAMGFTWAEEKKRALDLAFMNNTPDCYEVIEYYFNEIGLKINKNLLCKTVEFYDVKFTKLLIDSGVKLMDVDCNPFEIVAKERHTYKTYNYATLKDTETVQRLKGYYRQYVEVETYLYNLLDSFPRKKR